MNTLLICLSLLLGGGEPPARWPGFLGVQAGAIDPQSVPMNWSPTENIAWQAKLPGKGQSSPIIWNDRVFVTSIEGSMKDHCHVVALSLSDGHQLWDRKIRSTQTVRSNYFQSRSASTPVADADRVYAFFETGNCVALTHAGEPAWERDLVTDYGPFESNIGLATSPILIDGRLILLIDHEGPSYLLALDVQTGKTLWKTDRDSRKSYSTPAIVPIDGVNQIVCSSDGSVDGYDPATGKQIWTYTDVGGNTSFTPLPFGDGRFLIAASPGMHNEREPMARKSNGAMKVSGSNGTFEPTVQWRTEQAMPSFASPVVHRGMAYWVNRVGVVFCFDAETGKAQYSQRTKQVAWATPVGLGDRVYVFGKDGLTTVLAAGPEFKILAENQLWDPSLAPPAPMSRRGRDEHAEHGEGKPEASGAQRPREGVSATNAASPPSPPARESAKAEGGAPGERPAAQPPQAPAEGAGERGGRPPMTDAEREEARAKGEDRFADPVQYGVAIVNGSLVIRTGEVVYCVRQATAPK